MIKAILFDLDDTLIVDGPVTRQAFLAAAEVAGAPTGADPARLADAAAAAARRRWQESPHYEYCQRIGHSANEGLWARYNSGAHPTIHALREWAPSYRIGVWLDAFRQLGLPDSGPEAEALASACAERFAAARRQYPRFPEVDGLLAALHPRYRLGIVTNGVPDLQREKIAGSGVAHLFQASVVSGEIDIGKPNPGIFHHICRELGVEPAACVMVGDNPERDVAGAIRAGMKSVWVDRGDRPRDPRYPADLECTDLSALLPWLAQLEV